MQSFESEGAVRAPLELAFSIYTDVERWRNRSVFGDIGWVKGAPREAGSRLEVETRSPPFPSKVDHVAAFFGQPESGFRNYDRDPCHVRADFGDRDVDANKNAVARQGYSGLRICR